MDVPVPPTGGTPGGNGQEGGRGGGGKGGERDCFLSYIIPSPYLDFIKYNQDRNLNRERGE